MMSRIREAAVWLLLLLCGGCWLQYNKLAGGVVLPVAPQHQGHTILDLLLPVLQ